MKLPSNFWLSYESISIVDHKEHSFSERMHQFLFWSSCHSSEVSRAPHQWSPVTRVFPSRCWTSRTTVAGFSSATALDRTTTHPRISTTPCTRSSATVSSQEQVWNIPVLLPRQRTTCFLPRLKVTSLFIPLSWGIRAFVRYFTPVFEILCVFASFVLFFPGKITLFIGLFCAGMCIWGEVDRGIIVFGALVLGFLSFRSFFVFSILVALYARGSKLHCGVDYAVKFNCKRKFLWMYADSLFFTFCSSITNFLIWSSCVLNYSRHWICFTLQINLIWKHYIHIFMKHFQKHFICAKTSSPK